MAGWNTPRKDCNINIYFMTLAFYRKRPVKYANTRKEGVSTLFLDKGLRTLSSVYQRADSKAPEASPKIPLNVSFRHLDRICNGHL